MRAIFLFSQSGETKTKKFLVTQKIKEILVEKKNLNFLKKKVFFEKILQMTSPQPKLKNAVFMTGDWKTLEKYCLPIRMKVFVEEQKVPEDMEVDEHDPESVHLIACVHNNHTTEESKDNMALLQNGDLTPVGTGRLYFEEGSSIAKIGRMAVLQEYRGSGIGGIVLRQLIGYAKISGIAKQIILNAQVEAKKFYEKQGFKEIGEPFDEAGIPHVKMCLVF